LPRAWQRKSPKTPEKERSEKAFLALSGNQDLIKRGGESVSFMLWVRKRREREIRVLIHKGEEEKKRGGLA